MKNKIIKKVKSRQDLLDEIIVLNNTIPDDEFIEIVRIGCQENYYENFDYDNATDKELKEYIKRTKRIIKISKQNKIYQNIRFCWILL